MTDEEQKRLERFGRLRPPSFSVAESEDAQDFLDMCQWWKAYERRRTVGVAPLSWHEFSVLFMEKFVPRTRREELHRQFEQLQQEGMSVTQYEMRFSELARHAVWLVPNERERIRRFIDGLHYQLYFIMTQECVSGARFDELVDIARWIEMVRSQEREEREVKRPPVSGDLSGVPSGGQSCHIRGHPYRLAQMAHPFHRVASASHGLYSAHLGQSSPSALPAQSSSRAPSVQGSSVPGPSSSYSGTRGLIQSPPPPAGSCFECGEFGHMWRQCPRIPGGPKQ
ncbi:uncharacterized protein [Nicotiana tomentosiformis]|uniref:uncharacterized protein n=1 Tax=Nicotiana tomentosiformis TaxID=4098 RepID=UPI00388CC4AC